MFIRTSVSISFSNISSSNSAHAVGGSNQLSDAFICNKAANNCFSKENMAPVEFNISAEAWVNNYFAILVTELCEIFSLLSSSLEDVRCEEHRSGS